LQVFKKDHPKDFVQSGIWAWSRYANYFGEVTLWYGIFILAGAGVVESWQWVMVFSINN
jgi:steroid 5-alpha reductase family enzyme